MTTAQVPTDDWYTLRDATPAELKFVVETAARVLLPHPAADGHRVIPVVRWLEQAVPAISSLLDPAALPIVAVADGVVVGFCLRDKGSLAMLYVKREFRGHRVGLRLLWASDFSTDETIMVTNHTMSWEAWAKHHGIRWRRVEWPLYPEPNT